jgi:hypothetical protein
MLLRVVWPGLVSVKLSALVPFGVIVAGVNDLLMVGGVTTTTSTEPMSHAGPTGRVMPR